MPNCIITSINSKINIYFDDIVPLVNVKIINGNGFLVLENEYSDTNNVKIDGNEVAGEGFLTVEVKTGDDNFRKRLFYSKK